MTVSSIARGTAAQERRAEMSPRMLDFPVCRLVEQRVRALVETERQSVAHRMDHLERVARNARVILKSYPEADAEILYLAVLLHDVDQPFDDKPNHVARSAALAEQILKEIGYPPARIAHVLDLIREHSTETIDTHRPSTIEARILFDADKLDGIGPLGILRVFALSQQMGRPLAASVRWYREKIAVASRNVQTPEGQIMLEGRLPLVETFLSDLEADLQDD
ncbi:HD domain-containing protein [Inquilinus limosus]|uniref:HD domain-containing protein n=1 Tax=Inquilinus limosus TaxID=171674 RepID=UPI003F14CB7F